MDNEIKVLILDTETTGINAIERKGYERDEILQLSMVEASFNNKGKLLNMQTKMNRYFKPKNKTEWASAMAINGITPEMVDKCSTIDENIDDIINILNEYKVLIGQNISFDMNFLGEAIKDTALSNGLSNEREMYEYGVSIGDMTGHVIFDTMHEFSNLRKIPGRFNSYKWFKLSEEVDFYPQNEKEYFVENMISNENNMLDEKCTFHNSLTDVYMTGFVLNQLFKENQNLVNRLNNVDKFTPMINNLYKNTVGPEYARLICCTEDINLINEKLCYRKFMYDEDFFVFTSFLSINDELQATFIKMSDLGNSNACTYQINSFNPNSEKMFDMNNVNKIYSAGKKVLE